MDSGNVWNFEHLQVSRRYRFRLKTTGAIVIGEYKGEKGKSAGKDHPEREFEFKTEDGVKIFKGSEIVDPLYYG